MCTQAPGWKNVNVHTIDARTSYGRFWRNRRADAFGMLKRYLQTFWSNNWWRRAWHTSPIWHIRRLSWVLWQIDLTLLNPLWRPWWADRGRSKTSPSDHQLMFLADIGCTASVFHFNIPNIHILHWGWKTSLQSIHSRISSLWIAKAQSSAGQRPVKVVEKKTRIPVSK